MAPSDRDATKPNQRASGSLSADSLLSALEVGLLMVGPQNEIVAVNQPLCDLLGISRGALRLSHLKTEVPCGPLHDLLSALESFRVSPPGTSLRCSATWGEREVSLTLRHVYQDGSYVGVLVSAVDVTEFVRAEQEAREACRAKSELLANMSHEIRTPLSAIIGMTDLALRTELTAEQREYLEAVRFSGESVLGLLNDILDYSKGEVGKLSLEAAEFSLRVCVSDSLKVLAVRAHEKNVELLCDIRPEVPDNLLGDSLRLRQILTNLVSNAIKFTDVGHICVRVEGSHRQEDTVELTFSVQDTGEGIPAEVQESIFEPFKQGRARPEKARQGTGLGLAICRQLIELMGGRIWVESTEGEGSTFSFTAQFRTCPSRKEQPPGLQIPRGLAGLAVAENPLTRKILREILRRFDITVSEAASASGALSLLAEAWSSCRPYSLVILDLGLPETDGASLAAQLKANPQGKDLAIILMYAPGHPTANLCAKSREGFPGLAKPFTDRDVEDALLRCFVRRSPAPTPQAQEPGRTSGISYAILLAEDNHLNQKLALRLLQREGHHVTVVSNGKEAVQAAKDQRFDCILMDVQMPTMDGLMATAEIRRHEAFTGTHVPIVAMTAHAMKGDRERCLLAGMDAYLSKPFKPEDLFDTIHRLCTPSP